LCARPPLRTELCDEGVEVQLAHAMAAERNAFNAFRDVTAAVDRR
jgi:hypothetical protein